MLACPLSGHIPGVGGHGGKVKNPIFDKYLQKPYISELLWDRIFNHDVTRAAHDQWAVLKTRGCTAQSNLIHKFSMNLQTLNTN